jgi:hypothetical protein
MQVSEAYCFIHSSRSLYPEYKVLDFQSGNDSNGGLGSSSSNSVCISDAAALG